MTDTSWMRDGACRNPFIDPDTFFPTGETGPWTAAIDEAKSICAWCPVRGKCVSYALDTRQADGIWGGLTANERGRILRQQARNPGMTIAQARASLRRLPLADMFDARVDRRDDGHTMWLPSGTSLSVDGRNHTPRQIAFYLAHGRWPDGTVRGTCDVSGCLTPGHFTDSAMRRAAAEPTSVDLPAAA
ncbi:WhiB family transcriptional regulator [Streptomyces rubiginosohelvolus]|uniref:WhiB family transcriptional regulator n=1 Tax=Streptomyces rubiginosohelvolus TaxID=67362 RepID=UPI0033D090B3